jgi:hypothetical protein
LRGTACRISDAKEHLRSALHAPPVARSPQSRRRAAQRRPVRRDGRGRRLTRDHAIAAALRRLLPHLDPRDERGIVDRALGSRGLKTASPEAAAWLSAVAYARHGFTDYDQLLADGYDHESARHFTLDALNEVLRAWGARHSVGEHDDS